MNTKAMVGLVVVGTVGIVMGVGTAPAFAGRPAGGAHWSGNQAPQPNPMFHPAVHGLAAQHVQAMQHMQMVQQVQAHQMRVQQILASEPMQAAGRAVAKQQGQLLTLSNQLQAKARAFNHKMAATRGLTAAQKHAQLQALRNQIQAQARAVENRVQQELSRMTPEQREAFMLWVNGGWGPGWGAWDTEDPMNGYYDGDWAASFGGNY